MSDKMTPEIRFRGFSDDWEQRRLGEVFDQTSNLVNPREEHIELWSLTVARGLTPKTDRYNREFLVKKDDQFKTVANNEFIYNPMNMTLGASDLNLMGKTVAVSGYYITMISKDGYESNYFNIWLKSEIAIKKYKIYATGSLIERQRIQFPTLSKIKVLVPNLQEQEKIGTLFNRLDNTIALHLFKLETLKKLKQGYLHVMFPENQHPIPYLRFANFSSPWKQRRLGEVAKIQGGGTPSSENTEYWDGHINWFTPTEVFNNGYLLKSKRKITNIGLLKSSAKVLPVGTILMTSRAGVGSMGILTEPAATNQGFQSLILKNMSMSYFVYSMQEIISKKANRLASGSTFTEISGKEVAKMSIIIPNSNDEIKYIGNLFLKLDNAIDLHQTKIEKLQQIKKAYLQKMFI